MKRRDRMLSEISREDGTNGNVNFTANPSPFT
jgi:hypothetical protein